MGFLRRVLGGGTTATPRLGWYDLPPAGYFMVAGVEHHKGNLARSIPATREEVVYDDVPVTLHRDPRNAYDRNAVEVRLNDRLIGYIPREQAGTWTAYLARLDDAGYGARATARIRVVNNTYWINLRADPDASYGMPEEEAARAAERERAEVDRLARIASRKAEQAEKLAERKRASERREQAAAVEQSRRADGLCIACGKRIEATRRAGRPAVRCASCRAEVRNGST